MSGVVSGGGRGLEGRGGVVALAGGVVARMLGFEVGPEPGQDPLG